MKKFRFLRFCAALITSLLALTPALASVIPTDSVEPYRNLPISGGELMFIPDSLTAQVHTLLEGKSKVVRDNSIVDVNEVVVIGNDTVPVVIKQRNLGRFDRGLFNYLYVPKGVWQVGLSVSYAQLSSHDFELLDLLTDFDFTGHTFSIKPYISYFVKPNISVGMRLGYTNSFANLGALNLDIDEDLGFSINDVGYSAEAYTAAITSRQYVGLGRAGRFAIFNEVELAFSSGNSTFTRPSGDVSKTTHSTYMKAAVNFSPGVCIMMMKNVSFNLSFGVFGFNIKSEKQAVDGVPLGSRLTSGANFRFNIFNINFGLGIHI